MGTIVFNWLDKAIHWWADFIFGEEEDFEYDGDTTPYEERTHLEDA